MSELDIVLTGGPRDGERVRLNPDEPVILGRDVHCDVQILDSRLSRMHVRFEMRPDGVHVTDLQSTNGTLVNGDAIESRFIGLQDAVVVGSTEVMLAPAAEVSLPADGTISFRYEMEPIEVFSGIADGDSGDASGHSAERLRTLISISTVLNAVEELPALLEEVASTVVDIFDAERGCVLVRKMDGEMRRHHAYRDRKKRGEWPLSRTILGETLETGMSVMTANAGLDERFRSGDSIRVQDIKSVLCVPVESREEVLGAIYIDTVLSIRTYNREDLELLTAVGKQVGMAVKRELMKEEKELLFLDTIRAMVAAVEANDLYTAGHSVRVAKYAGTLGEALGFNRAFIRRLKYAANLHDVGKVGIPTEILNKPGRLTEEEFKLIQQHPEIGVRIIENIRNIDDIVESVLYHHERIDGKGYPEGIVSGEIPVMSKLIAVADSFDAMTSTRAYREAMTAEEAAAEFKRCAGTQFEAEFALKMVDLIEEGSMVPIEGDCDPFA